MGDETVDFGQLMPLSVSRRVSRLRKAISPYEVYGIGEVIAAVFEEGVVLPSGYRARVVWVPGLNQWYWSYNDPKTKILTPAFEIIETDYTQEKFLLKICSPEFSFMRGETETVVFHTEGVGWHTIDDDCFDGYLYMLRDEWNGRGTDAAS